ncbi:hypothetical protein GCM10010384_68590 [Streptomyces djakartensis]|uniref:Uncharacterized protein n=1 Tax=Streptomyces djakartensis TaxID=68193 RepID=A0ABQ3AJM8_9ACTN|nr:hypothetical protein GCM10010384_68590 [Streptomyces djakartensis]
MPLRAAHSVLGFSQEIFSTCRGINCRYAPRSSVPQPAPSAVSREEWDTGAP